MLDDRKMQVLRAIVTDYVASREPVGSKALVERHQLGVSPATVRNDMAVLEEEGYIAQPHTSAGRIPTDKGYRLFVDKLATIKPLSAAERRAINAFMAGALDVNDLVTRTVRLLAQLTHQVAIVQYPAAQRSTIAHVELVQLAPGRLLVIMVSSTGRVDQQILELPGLGAEDVHLASLKLREAALGYTAADAATRIAVTLDELDPARRVRINPVFAVALELLGADPVAQVVVAGVPNLAGHSFTTGLRPLLEALEEQVVLLRLLDEATSDDVTVRIGAENTPEGFKSTSLVATGYSVGNERAASLGVVGPTRMDYPSTIASVRAVARYVSRILTEG
ncbi:heat-inducible transcriptional repressor HrcA [Arachnia rubra]|jgi:heat-inducible transcription repressor hrcA|uniref:Heat-inducible transcription repressor HrcA n=1 Tax=Arachnia rubra TaxID=1547448 RepID=A0ABX7Y8P1_9ACTN|nr:heat-inducible transcriptional repressor HrcA [Arachnia rubra]MBB1570647.1 heat-inducible transcriptional repressor HrcA [Propionibacterium sp.]QUC09422.1 heat-inducible transcriptional repressor HrcA [Arachnia rubra]BCR80909.1 heat-inducible transcription repressor HrcA [Arachnia rubra]